MKNDYWNTHIPYSKGTYEEMYKLRYGLQDYLHDTFCFQDFKGKRVLEVGCGVGLDAVEFAENGAEVYAIDSSDKAVNHTKELFEKLGLKANIEKADVTKLPFNDYNEGLPFNDNYFDLVYAFGILHHVVNIDTALQEILRVLKPDGDCFAMVYNKDSLLYYYSILYLRGIQEKGFAKYSAEELLNKYSESKENCPYTKVYTKLEIVERFIYNGFREVFVCVEYPVIDTLDKRKVKIDMPKHLGWHLIVKAKKGTGNH